MRVHFETARQTVIKAVSMTASALAPDGSELIDFKFHGEHSSRVPFEIPGNFVLEQVPASFDLFLSDIRVDGAVFSIPVIHFHRADHWDCVPLLVNF